MSQSAACHDCARTSRDASLSAATTSAPVVSRPAPAVAPGLAGAGFAPSRIPAGTCFPGAALAARMPLRRPSQVPVARVEKEGGELPRYTSPVHDVVGQGGGQPLDPKARADMEAQLGSDFSNVRIHTGDTAALSAAAISATAYTVGNDVVFGQGSFDPASHEGRHRLAHELVHVQQQRNGPVSGTDSGGGVVISDPADSFEREAEATATRVVSGPQRVSPGGLHDHHQGGPPVQAAGGRPVQRCGGMPCDCAADEEASVQKDSVDALAFRAVQRAAVARSHDALRGDQILPQPRTTAKAAALQRQQDQTAPAPGAPAIPASDLASVGDCAADGGTLNAQVFKQEDGTPEPKLNDVYNDRDRLLLGTHDAIPNGPVRRVQTALICAGYGVWLGLGQADGKYGPATNATLKLFKRDHNLQPAYLDDVGPKTMHCLNNLAADCKPPPPAPTPPGPAPTPPGPGPVPPSPHDFPIKNADLTITSTPAIERAEATGMLLLTVHPGLWMTGTAEIDARFDPSLFKFHFYQIGRPFQTDRATYWFFSDPKACDPADPKPTSTTEGVDDDASDELRKGGPQQDAADTGPEKSTGWYPLQGLKIKGTARKPQIPFADTPQQPFGYKEVEDPTFFDKTHLRSAEWADFFFTAFCVQLPDGTVVPLKSVYWTVRYAEFCRPKCPNEEGVDRESAQKQVDVGSIMDGAPSEPGLDKAGKPQTPVWNEFSRNVHHTVRHETFSVNPPAKI